MNAINLADKFALIDQFWSPKIVAEVNDFHVKLAILKGEFVWHQHENEDELFLVIKGDLTVRLRDRELLLHEGDLVVVPKGIEHLPIADREVLVLLLEPKTTINTGTQISDRTRPAEWI